MDEWMQQALEIVKAQAQVKVMTEEEITSLIQKLSCQFKAMMTGVPSVEAGNGDAAPSDLDPKKAIREQSIICLECGKRFKIIAKRHLAHHGLTPEQYTEKYGYPKGTPLICKSLQRERRKKMKGMKLWERRGKAE